MTFKEGTADESECPRCSDRVIVARCDGFTVKLSRKNVPVEEARILSKHFVLVYNVFRLTSGSLLVTTWWGNMQPPSRGRLLVRHACTTEKGLKL